MDGAKFVMHIVVIGGGAAGMASAYYLAKNHQVTVLEKQPQPGGNIRTLNRNVESKLIPDNLFIDNGVIEFHKDFSPALTGLIDELGLKLEPFAGGSTSIFRDKGRSVHMPGAIRLQQWTPLRRVLEYFKLAIVLSELLPIGMRMLIYRNSLDRTLDDLLGKGVMTRWIKMLLMYGYSIPYANIGTFPAPLAVETLRRGVIGTRWVRLDGGVYQYIDAIEERAGDNITVRTGVQNIKVRRLPESIVVNTEVGDIRADAVVFATPPDQVLQLLPDASELERRCFCAWEPNYAETIIHTDESIYSRWDCHAYTEFDLFEKAEGADAGYNAYLNRLIGLDDGHPVSYFLAYNLEDMIAPEKIIDRQQHHTPWYTARATAHIGDIKAMNGDNRTYHAGAYLYNGLHEGAIQSALAIRDLFES